MNVLRKLLFLPLALALAWGTAAVTHGEEEDRQKAEEAEVETLSGQLIDAHEYLLWGTEGKPQAEEERDRLRDFFTRPVPDMPFVLVPDEQSLDLLGRILPGEAVLLVVFDPDEAESKDAYRAVQDKVGQSVHVTGTLHARDGLSAISVRSVIEHPAEETAEIARDG